MIKITYVTVLEKIEYLFVMYFECITKLAHYSAELPLRAGLIYMCYVNTSISDVSIKHI